MSCQKPEWFITLGSGDIGRAGCGTKAACLDRARQNGLPVPSGVVVTDECLQKVYKKIIPEQLLAAAISALPLSSNISVRSAFSLEDSEDQSHAGFFRTVLDVDKNDADQIIKAFRQVWQSADRVTDMFRRDILIMDMVAARYSGIAFTESEFEDDLVNWTDGMGSKLVSGEIPGQKLQIPKIRKWEGTLAPSGNASIPEFYDRLQKLLREVRGVFGKRDWDIEWADDGTCCWLLQVRPITRQPAREEWFGLSNHKEILPPLPSTFMNSLITECAPDLFSFYRQMDSELPRNRPLVESFRGRPYFNLSLLEEMTRRWGLPTQLLKQAMGGIVKNDFGLNIQRVIREWKVFIKLGLLQTRAVWSARRTGAVFKKLFSRVPEDIPELTEVSKKVYTQLVHQMLMLTLAMSGPIALLRIAGTLNENSFNQFSQGTRILKDLEPLISLVGRNPEMKKTLDVGQIPKNEKFETLWKHYLERHGSRGIYESDLAQPRFREDPSCLIKTLACSLTNKPERKKYTLRGILTLPIWWYVRPIIHAREILRYETMKLFDVLRQHWLAQESNLKKRSLIPEKASIWDFTFPELMDMDSGKEFTGELYDLRLEEIEANRNFRMPDFLSRHTFLDDYREHSIKDSDNSKFYGLSLTGGRVDGKAWVLREPQVDLPEAFQKSSTILVAPAVDAGWLPTFSRVSGVVVDTGGDLSHGSIILRELGIPAITNASGTFQSLRTGDNISLFAGEGVLVKGSAVNK